MVAKCTTMLSAADAGCYLCVGLLWQVLKSGPACERLQVEHPPLAYYSSPMDAEEPAQVHKQLRSSSSGGRRQSGRA